MRNSLLLKKEYYAATVDAQTGRYVVAFEFDKKGAKKFAKVTTDNTYQRLAILLDNKVIRLLEVRETLVVIFHLKLPTI